MPFARAQESSEKQSWLSKNYINEPINKKKWIWFSFIFVDCLGNFGRNGERICTKIVLRGLELIFSDLM